MTEFPVSLLNVLLPSHASPRTVVLGEVKLVEIVLLNPENL